MDSKTAELKHIALDLLGHLNQPDGSVPCSFRAGLFDLFAKADPSNTERLAAAFPEVAYVIRRYQNTGLDGLRVLINRQTPAAQA